MANDVIGIVPVVAAGKALPRVERSQRRAAIRANARIARNVPDARARRAKGNALDEIEEAQWEKQMLETRRGRPAQLTSRSGPRSFTKATTSLFVGEPWGCLGQHE